MDREELERDRADLQKILDEIESGKVMLEHGQDEYLASLRRRIAHLDEKIAETG